MLRRRLTAVVCAAAIGLGAAGCGGSDDDGSSGNTGGSAPTADRTADEQALTKLSDQLGEIGRSRDAAAYCKLFDPVGFATSLGTQDQCVRVFQPLLDKAGIPDDLTVEDIQFEGDKALVTYQGDGGTGAYVKVDGKWYIVAPSIDNATKTDSAQ